MKKLLIALVCIVALSTVIGLTGCSADGAAVGAEEPGNVTVNVSGQQEGLWVSGEGKVMAAPDIANITLGIEAQATTVAEAQATATAAMEAVMDALDDQGIDDKDIQTQYFNIYNVTRWVEAPDERGSKEEVVGYRVTNMVTVKVRDIERAGEVIDAVVAAGGDNIRVNNVGFDIEDKTPYYAEARAKAMQYAKAKAEQLAEGAGVELGQITYITENNYTPGPIYRNVFMEDSAMGASPSATTSISAGQLELSTTVQLVYDIN